MTRINFILLVLSVWISGSGSGQALEIKIVENQMIVTGPITVPDAREFGLTLNKHPQVDTLVLRQMPGGRAVAMEQISAMVEKRKLTTIVSGLCLSACAHIFLAGEKRQFSDDFPLVNSFLGYHGTYPSANSGDGWMGDVPDNTERWYVKRSGGKLDPQLVLDWLRLDHASGLARVYHPKLKGRFSVVTFLCERRMALSKCKQLEKSALEYGVITTGELGHVKDTPYWTPDLYKKTTLHVKELMHGDTLTDEKKGDVEAYLKDPKRRAMVMSGNGRWLLWSSKIRLDVAIATAIFRCRARTNGQCHVIALDDALVKTPLQIDRLRF